MPLRDYQKQVDDWIQGYDPAYWPPLSQLARLTEEVGELARALNHKYGEKIKKSTEAPDDIEGELADIIFDVICLANSEGIDLDEAMQKQLHKVTTRDADRFPKKKP